MVGLRSLFQRVLAAHVYDDLLDQSVTDPEEIGVAGRDHLSVRVDQTDVELAGDPLAITLMLGMEMDSLSMNPISIPKVKKILRSVTKEQSEKLIENVLSLKTASDVVRYLKKKTSHILPGDVKKLHIVDG